MRVFGLIAGLGLVPGLASAAEFISAYTDLDFEHCTTIESDDTGAMLACPGYKGVPVMVGEGDLRMFVSFGLSSTTEPAAEQTLGPFNHLGKKIEWRLDADGVPRATILRWFTQREEGQEEGQLLVVTQIVPGATCQMALVDVLATKNANAVAQRIADTAGSFDCTNEPERVEPFEAF
jgi:hypothetical protein